MYLVNQESTRRGNRKKKKQGQTETGLEPTRKTGFETDNGVEMAILFSPDEPDACSTTLKKQGQKPIRKLIYVFLFRVVNFSIRIRLTFQSTRHSLSLFIDLFLFFF